MSSNSQRLEPKTGSGTIAINGVGTKGDERVELRRVGCFLTESLFKRALRRIFPDQRKQERHAVPPLVGYLGTACSSMPYELGDISLTGFCLLTDERWMPGTEMPVTLQRTNWPAQNDSDYFTVQATVVRCDNDGVGFSIVLCEDDSQAAYGNPLRVRWVTKVEMEQFLKRMKEHPGWEPSEDKASPRTEPASAHVKAGVVLKAAFEGGR